MIVKDHWRMAWLHANRRSTALNTTSLRFHNPYAALLQCAVWKWMAMDTLSWTACLWQKCWQCGHVFVRFWENLSQGSSLCGQDISIGELSIWHYCIAGSGKHLKWFCRVFLGFYALREGCYVTQDLIHRTVTMGLIKGEQPLKDTS